MNRAWVVLMAASVSACGLVEELAGKLGGAEQGRPDIEAVPHERLLQVLPQVEGWQSHAPQSTRISGQARDMTVVSASYSREVDGQEQTVELEIVDGAGSSAINAPFALMAHSAGPAHDVHKRSITVQGHRGIEDWNPETASVTSLLMVGGRFRVTLRGSNVSPDTAKAHLERVDLKQLASWAKQE